MNYFKLFFNKNSILRDFQKSEFEKIKLKGHCIEFGANNDLVKNFLNYKNVNYKSHFSNITGKSKKLLR